MFQEQIDVTDIDNVEQSAITKLTRDMRNAASELDKNELRYLVDAYYQMQDDRIRAKGRLRAFSESQEPHELIAWLSDNTAYLEKQIGKALLAYAESTPTGRWCVSVHGIAGVLTAGLLSHIDIEKAPNVGHIYSFAGIAPNGKKWNKGEKRPFNAQLKVLCWKIGESFVKVSGKEDAYYGQVYRKAKDRLVQQNDNGMFKDVAAQILKDKKFGKDTDAFKAYSEGKLPPAHVHARAKREAVSLFLSHFWEVLYRYTYPDRECKKPYAISVLGHDTYIPIWNSPFE